jgi:hypothetical protein
MPTPSLAQPLKTVPARIKGSATVTAVMALRKWDKERARQLLPPHLHHYLEDRILLSAWYPETDHLELIRALDKISREKNPELQDDPLEIGGRMLARHNFSGVYSHLISPGDPETTLRHAAAMWQSYHDTGLCSVLVIGPRRVRLEVRNYGLPSTEVCRTRAGFYSEMVRMSGGTDVVTSELHCSARGAPSCILEVEWK